MNTSRHTLPGLPGLTLCVLLLLATPLAAQPADADAGPGACVLCHADAARVPDAAAREPVELLAADVHGSVGLSCHDCHGGDRDADLSAADAMARAHAADAGFQGRPAPAEIPAFCGRCHSDAAYMSRYDPEVRVDQEARFATSVHGERLAAGDTQVANCVSCHGRHPGGGPEHPLAHGITRVDDPRGPVYAPNVAATCGRCHGDADYMADYDLPTDQQAHYELSVHNARLQDGDISAPTCNDCHGNHGARPPGVASLAYVCGSCHGRQAELFRDSSMGFAFEMMELGECIVCHGNHQIVPPDDEMLVSAAGGREEGVQACDACHEDADDPGLLAGKAMRAGLGGLEQAIADARADIDEARTKGMLVSEAEFHLTGADDALIEARVLIHGFDAEAVAEVVDEGSGIAEEAETLGETAIEDYYFRHRWLAISLVGIAFAIFTLVLKVRQVDRRWRARAAVGEEA